MAGVQGISIEVKVDGLDKSVKGIKSLTSEVRKLRDTSKSLATAQGQSAQAMKAQRDWMKKLETQANRTAKAVDRLTAAQQTLNTAVRAGNKLGGAAASPGSTGGKGGGSSNNKKPPRQPPKKAGLLDQIINSLPFRSRHLIRGLQAAGKGLGLSSGAALGVGLAGAGAILGGLATFVQSTGAGNNYIDQWWRGGGTWAQNMRGAGIGSVMGFNFADRSHQFAQTLHAGGPAAAFGRTMGINPNASIFGGDLNYQQKLLKAVEKITSPQMSDQNARIIAEAMGLTDFLAWRELSGGTRAKLLAGAGLNMTKEEARIGLEGRYQYEISKTKLINTWERVGANTIVPLATKLLEGVEFLADYGGAFFGLPGMIGLRKSSSGSDHTKAVDGNKKALDQNTAALNSLTHIMDGIYGGGGRAKGAIPAGWQGNHSMWNQIENQFVAESMRLGAFVL